MTRQPTAIATALLVVALISPALAEPPATEMTCKEISATVGAVKVKPDLFLGVIEGDLEGAIGLVTLKEWTRRDGSRTSVVELTFTARNQSDGFQAMLSVVDTPQGVNYARSATGSITEGKGAFEKVKGKLEMSGVIDEVQGELKSGFSATLCAPK